MFRHAVITLKEVCVSHNQCIDKVEQLKYSPGKLRSFTEKGRIRDISRSNKTPFIALKLATPIILALVLFLVASVNTTNVIAQESDYDEYFYSITPGTYDSDSDGYDDSVSLEMDVDTTGGFVDIAVDGYLEDESGFITDSDFTTWSIYGEDTDYGYLDLTVTQGYPGYYTYNLILYDDLIYQEDYGSGSVYLYPIGYGSAPQVTAVQTPHQTYTPFPTPTPSDGGLSSAVLGGTGAAVVILIAAPVLFTVSRSRKRRVASNTRIRELKAQMERWREQGYDVSELEDLFK
jgi:hypothetical protein